jgi:hypothetical protein
MKIQNIFRMQVAVITIGAALLLAGTARAQEIDNPSFDEGANSVAFTQPSPVPAAADLQNVAQDIPVTVTASSVAVNPALNNSSEGRTIAAIILCFALATVLWRAAKRPSRLFPQ